MYHQIHTHLCIRHGVQTSVKCKGDFKRDIYLDFYVEDARCTRKSVEGPINVAPYYYYYFWGAPLFLR
jgi:hypothetical protein